MPYKAPGSFPAPRKRRTFPIQATFIVCVDKELETELSELLQIITAQDPSAKVWSNPTIKDANQDTLTRWSETFEKVIGRYLSCGRTPTVRSIYMIGTPQSEHEAIAVNDLCPHSRIIYIGQPFNSLTPCERHHSLKAAIKHLIVSGHSVVSIDPKTGTEMILCHILDARATTTKEHPSKTSHH